VDLLAGYINSKTYVDVGKLSDVIFKLFRNWSSVRSNLGALSVESERERRLLKVNV